MDIISGLRDILGKEHLITDDQKIPWGKDWTKAYTPAPLAAAFPSTTDEVVAILKLCSQNNIAVVPSGGRTGLSGGAVAAKNELVLSLSRMRKIFGINPVDRILHCQAGVITKEVQKAALDKGFYFPVDFASSGSSHIGGNIATNAGGIKVIRYGLMRDWVAGLQVVLADGQILNLDNSCMKNNTGYDLRQLFIGSEGTLGIITECHMRLTSPPGSLQVNIFAVPTLEAVTKLFELTQSMKLNLMAYELFTDFGLKRVQEHTGLKAPFDKSYPFYALVEVEKSEIDDPLIDAFVQKAFDEGLIEDGVASQSHQQYENFWGLRENIAESLTALTVAHKNDISLPLISITPFCTDLQALVKREYPGFEVVLFGHIGDGNLHINFTKPENMSKEEFFAFAKKADHHMFELVKKYGGSISAEHGIGLTKKEFLSYSRTSAEIDIMRKIKKIFDPQGIMNPGKVF